MQASLKHLKANGFTIVELLIVIAVIGILAAIGIVSYSGVQKQAIDRGVLSDIDGVDGEVTHYSVNNNAQLGAAVAWYSPNGANTNIPFTVSPGDIVDVVADTSTYCIRVYNPSSASYKTLATAATKESSPGACSALPPSAAATGTPRMYASVAWTQSTSAGARDWSAIAISSDGTQLVAADYTTSSGYLYRSTDGGINWTQLTGAGVNNWYSVVLSANGTKIIALDPSYATYTSLNSGATWSTNIIYVGAVAASGDATKIVAGRDSGNIYTSTNSGIGWTSQPSAGSRRWLSVASSDDGTKLAAANYGGYIYTSTDSGITWTQQNGSGSKLWKALTSSSDGTKLAAIERTTNYIYTSTDSGVTWTQRASAGARTWTAIDSSSDGTKLAATNFGGYIYTSNDSGATWTAQTGAGIASWSAVTITPDANKLAAAAKAGGYIYTGLFN